MKHKIRGHFAPSAYLVASLGIASIMSIQSCSRSDARSSSELPLTVNVSEESPEFNNPLKDQYPEIPDERMLSCGPLGDSVYAELQARYAAELKRLRQAVEATGAKLVVVIASPEVHATTLSPSNVLGLPFISRQLDETGIEKLDLSPEVRKADPLVVTQLPKDGHWSKAGAELVANALAGVIRKYDSHRSAVTYPDAKRTATFGDQIPGSDEILDGGKGLPYHVVINSQGLRMEKEVSFPKKSQRVLLLGDSELFFPFLDNEHTGSALLQNMFPDKEILNASRLGYSINDYVSLFEEKAKYCEPDIVIVGANGNDILDLFFSNRNKVSREKKPFQPSLREARLYKHLFSPGDEVVVAEP